MLEHLRHTLLLNDEGRDSQYPALVLTLLNN